jgi:DNA-binding PadR family transcriptional regulator
MRVEARTDSALSPQPAILGFLMLGPRHPYELYKVFDTELGRVWRLGRSHLYAHLAQMAEAGLTTVRTEARAGHPARNIYRITPAGRQMFHDWIRQPTHHVRHIRIEFLARLYFHRRLDLPDLGRLVARQKKIIASRIRAVGGAIQKTDDAYWRLVLEFRLREMEVIDGWLDLCNETP